MLRLEFTTKFKKDFKRIKKQGRNLKKLKVALKLLQTQSDLPRHCVATRSKGIIEVTVNCTSSRIGCSSTASTAIY